MHSESKYWLSATSIDSGQYMMFIAVSIFPVQKQIANNNIIDVSPHTIIQRPNLANVRIVCINAIIGHMQSIAFGGKKRAVVSHIGTYIGRMHTTNNAHCTPHHWIHQMTVHSTQCAYVESITTRNNDLSCEQFNAMDDGCWSEDNHNNALWHATNVTHSVLNKNGLPELYRMN